ncbi:MAG: hypothetical protein IJE88_05585 [Akkermansia sp.]|nr:hypothetical protein [Akkermansia sp.]
MNKTALRSLFSALLLAASILSAESSAQVKMLEKPDEVFLKKNAGKRGVAAKILKKGGLMGGKIDATADYYLICSFIIGDNNPEWVELFEREAELREKGIQIVVSCNEDGHTANAAKRAKAYLKKRNVKAPCVFRSKIEAQHAAGKATPTFWDFNTYRYKAIRYDGAQAGGGSGMDSSFKPVLEKIEKDRAANQ